MLLQVACFGPALTGSEQRLLIHDRAAFHGWALAGARAAATRRSGRPSVSVRGVRRVTMKGARRRQTRTTRATHWRCSASGRR
jgi:hypothetical protein